jgi:hypothetical protein
VDLFAEIRTPENFSSETSASKENITPLEQPHILPELTLRKMMLRGAVPPEFHATLEEFLCGKLFLSRGIQG